MVVFEVWGGSDGSDVHFNVPGCMPFLIPWRSVIWGLQKQRPKRPELLMMSVRKRDARFFG